MDRPAYDVRHNAEHHRFECTVDQHLCVADYRRAGDTLLMTHTGVHASLQGRGIAAALVRTALEFARSQGLKVDPQCSYVQVYMQRHPETQALLA
jgi:predicted GNAT family acetyltransferase